MQNPNFTAAELNEMFAAEQEEIEQEQLDEAVRAKRMQGTGDIAIDQPSADHHRAAAKEYRKTAATLIGMIKGKDDHHTKNAVIRALRLAQKHDKWASESGK